MQHTKIIHIIFIRVNDESFSFTQLPTKRGSIFFPSIEKISDIIKFFILKNNYLENYF
jgi:hypothetical protein